MRKRNIALIAIAAVIIINIIVVIVLSIRNSKIKFISSDEKQSNLICEICSELLATNENYRNSKIKLDKTAKTNFITYTNYDYKYQEKIEKMLEESTNKDSENEYLLSVSFDINKMRLIINFNSNDENNIYSYKLSTDKKNNSIKYKLINDQK